jgi:benzaldehyde dehydrogenase (NAD)
VVLEDADIEQAARAGSFGSFHNAGQVCMSASRHLVAALVVEEYTPLLTEEDGKLKVEILAGTMSPTDR